MGARQPLRDGTGDSIGAHSRREPQIRQTGIPMRHKEKTLQRREWLARLAAFGGLGLAGQTGEGEDGRGDGGGEGSRPSPSGHTGDAVHWVLQGEVG